MILYAWLKKKNKDLEEPLLLNSEKLSVKWSVN